MTRNEILQAALQRCGAKPSDTNARDMLNTHFDFVLGEMAEAGILTSLIKNDTFELADGTRYYSTRTMASLTAPRYPTKIKNLRVWVWGETQGFINQETDELFESRRLRGGDASGRPRAWRYYPNETQIEVYPVPGPDEDEQEVSFLYMAPPTILAGANNVEEVRFQDLPTLIKGLRYYGLKELMDPDDMGSYQIDLETARLDWESMLGPKRREAALRLYTSRAKQAVYAQPNIVTDETGTPIAHDMQQR